MGGAECKSEMVSMSSSLCTPWCQISPRISENWMNEKMLLSILTRMKSMARTARKREKINTILSHPSDRARMRFGSAGIDWPSRRSINDRLDRMSHRRRLIP
ncbi:unnamed protein product [Scytosiphon promiscuus]